MCPIIHTVFPYVFSKFCTRNNFVLLKKEMDSSSLGHHPVLDATQLTSVKFSFGTICIATQTRLYTCWKLHGEKGLIKIAAYLV